VVGHIFQARPVWIYTQSNITNIIYSPEYTTPTQKKSYYQTIVEKINCLNSFHQNFIIFATFRAVYCPSLQATKYELQKTYDYFII
jgi:hypothetical protein